VRLYVASPARYGVAPVLGLPDEADTLRAIPLSRLPRRLRRPLAVAIGLGLLNELARLHGDGAVHGSLKPKDVLIGSDGSVRLARRQPARADSERERSAARLAEVWAAGAILCRLIGAPLAAPEHGAEAPLKHTVRRIATMSRQKRPGYEAMHASLMLWEGAGRLSGSRAQAQATAELGKLVAACHERPSMRPPRLTVVPHPAPQQPPAPAPRSGPGPALAAVAAAAALLATAAAVLAWSPHAPARHLTAAVSTIVPGPAQTPVADYLQGDLAAASPPVPAAVAIKAPDLPSAAGDVRSVALNMVGPCSPGMLCHVQVRVGLISAPSVRSVSWTISAACTADGSRQILAGGGMRAAPGWNLVIGDSLVTIPANVPALAAVVTDPAQAASSPVSVGSAAC
jgi:hypothetical protein